MDLTLVNMTKNIKQLRNMSGKDIYNQFYPAMVTNSIVAMKWLLYVRDIQHGLGQRKIFQEIINNLIWDERVDLKYVRQIIPIIQRVGRWDDVLHIIWKSSYINPKNSSVLSLGIYTELYVQKQLQLDLAIAKGECDGVVSLLAKWLPSINTSSLITRAHARYLAKTWGMTEKEYRKTLSFLREHLDVVERKMCQRDWDSIDWREVPSTAKCKYNKSLSKHKDLNLTKPIDIRFEKNWKQTEPELVEHLLFNSRYNL